MDGIGLCLSSTAHWLTSTTTSFEWKARSDLEKKGTALPLASSCLRCRPVHVTEGQVDFLAFLPSPCYHLMLIFLPGPLDASLLFLGL